MCHALCNSQTKREVGLTQCLAPDWVQNAGLQVCAITLRLQRPLVYVFPQGASGALALIELLKQRTVLRETQQFGLRSHGLGTGLGLEGGGPLVPFSQACVLSATKKGWPGRGSTQQQGSKSQSPEEL